MGGQNDPLADIAVNAVAQVRLIQAAREAAPDAIVVHASTRQFYGRVTEAAGGREPAGGAARRQRRVEIRRRAILDAGAPRARPSGGVAAADQLLRPAAAHPRRAADLPRHLDPLRAGRPAVRGLGRRAVARPDLCRRRHRGVPARRGPRRRATAASSTSAARRRRRCATWRSWWCAWPGRRRTTPRASSRPIGRSIDIGSYHADDRAFRAATGWAPTVALEEGIGRTLDWYRPRLADYL